jgi:hypothetical protein
VAEGANVGCDVVELWELGKLWALSERAKRVRCGWVSHFYF